MESFGRTIALGIGIIGVIFLLLFSKIASARWQRHEAVRSMSQGFAGTLLCEKRISLSDWQAFQKEVARLGGYRAELTVYEKRRFEDEDGGKYLYEKSEILSDKALREGSYLRVIVMQVENRRGGRFLFGDCGVIVVGGRVQ